MYKSNIEFYRKQQDLTLTLLAQKTNLSIGYLCHLEKGSRKNPSADVMEKIAKELNKNVNEVFFS